MTGKVAPLPNGVRAAPAAHGRRAIQIRRPMAILAARISSMLVGAAGHQGTSLPGALASAVWPDALESLAGQLDSTILVIGTNGKTTTAALIERMVREPGRPPIANRSGANMRQGIVTPLVRASDLRGRLRHQGGRLEAVFEVDEAALEQILPRMGPTVIVATNLFRDQLDRYGEADAIVDRWAGALGAAAIGSALVYCADDPRLAMLAARLPLPATTFGLAGPPDDRIPTRPDDPVSDPVACRACGRQLVYRWRSIGHLGDFACPAGHVHRMTPDVIVDRRPRRERGDREPARSREVELVLTDAVGSVVARPSLPGLANAYNVAAAFATAGAAGRERVQCAAAVTGFDGPYGRFEHLEIEDRHVILMLTKNTVSLGETALLGPELAPDVVLLALNDAPADGRDVSWIWDASLGALVADRHVVVTGTRAADLALRLKYDRHPAHPAPTSVATESALEAGLDAAIARTPPNGTLLITATYTAMMGLRTLAQRRGGVRPAPR